MSQVGEDWRAFDVIGVDEGQFFDDVSQQYSIDRLLLSLRTPPIKAK